MGRAYARPAKTHASMSSSTHATVGNIKHTRIRDHECVFSNVQKTKSFGIGIYFWHCFKYVAFI